MHSLKLLVVVLVGLPCVSSFIHNLKVDTTMEGIHPYFRIAKQPLKSIV